MPKCPFISESSLRLLVCNTFIIATSFSAESLIRELIISLDCPTSLKSSNKSATPSITATVGAFSLTTLSMIGNRSEIAAERKE
ncbi:Uncharacterised protein [Segatella copri]|nr:Uncharacterised protein [Segatella copri]